MVIDATEQFHPFGSGPVIGAVVDDQNGLSVVIGQGIENGKQTNTYTKEQLPPVKAGTSEYLVGCVLTKCVISLMTMPRKKFFPVNGSEKMASVKERTLCHAVCESRIGAGAYRSEIC